jgi:hypothetical protein
MPAARLSAALWSAGVAGRSFRRIFPGGLREKAVPKSLALQLARWTRTIPAEFRPKAEEILVMAARAGARLRELAAIYAEIRSGRHQRGPQPRRKDHPQPQPTQSRVTAPAEAARWQWSW